jgi:hypothetical protein
VRQVVYHLNHTFSSFCFNYFSNRVLHFLPGQASNLGSSYLYLPHSRDYKAMHHHAWLII